MKKFRIVPMGMFFRVDVSHIESCGFLFLKKRKVRTPINRDGTVTSWGSLCSTYTSIKEAMEFIECMKKQNEIEYIL